MKFHFNKYHGTGNDFVIFNGINQPISLSKDQIKKICDRRFGIGGDGVIIFDKAGDSDFKMIYFNSDGNESTMCGNGGRCLVQFAKRHGYITNKIAFTAVDGLHRATISSDNPIEVSLLMNDVNQLEINHDFVFLDTGSPHYVAFANHVKNLDVLKEGRIIRNSERFKKQGVNVNFVQVINNELLIRTYERGVEDETLSCGTGVTASVLAAVATGKIKDDHKYNVITPGGNLRVEYERTNTGFKNVYLIGPAIFVFEGDIEL